MLNPNDQYKTNIVPHVSRSSPVVGPPGQGAPVKKSTFECMSFTFSVYPFKLRVLIDL